MTRYFFLQFTPFAILAAELATAMVLARRRVNGWFAIVCGSYLLLVATAVVLALVVQDDFGYSWIPALQFTAPWSFAAENNAVYAVPVGTAINCAVFLIAGSICARKFPIQPRSDADIRGAQ